MLINKRNLVSIIHSIFLNVLGSYTISTFSLFHWRRSGKNVVLGQVQDLISLNPKLKIIHLQLEGFFQISSCISRFLWFSGSEEVKGNQ